MTELDKAWERFSREMKEYFIAGWNGSDIKLKDLRARLAYSAGETAKAASDAQLEMNLADFGVF